MARSVLTADVPDSRGDISPKTRPLDADKTYFCCIAAPGDNCEAPVRAELLHVALPEASARLRLAASQSAGWISNLGVQRVNLKSETVGHRTRSWIEAEAAWGRETLLRISRCGWQRD